MTTFKKILHTEKFKKEPAIYDEPKDFYFWIGIKAMGLLIIVSLIIGYATWRLN